MNAPVQDKKVLLEQLAAHEHSIREFGVNQLGLFGSFATNNSVNSQSDVDFLVKFNKDKKTFDNFMELSFFLENLLGRRVELVTTEALSKYIGPLILKQVEYVIL